MEFDFDGFKSLAETINTARGTTQKVADVVRSVKEIAQSSKRGRSADLERSIAELAQEVAQAQLANAKANLALAGLEKEVAEHKAFASDIDRYALWETPTGSIVYRIKPEAQGDEPTHYLCPNCMESKRKSILQGHAKWRKCLSCDAEFRFEQDTGMPRVPMDFSLRGDIS